jgi:TPR repeat protein
LQVNRNDFEIAGRPQTEAHAAAVEWFRKSADQGYADAQNNT